MPAGVVNRVAADDAPLNEAEALAREVAKRATRAHAAHYALLRAWRLGGVAAADETCSPASNSLCASVLDVETSS